MMARIYIVLTAVVLGACAWLGCGGGEVGAEKLEAAVKKLEGFKSEMCACKTKECADKVDSSVADWKKTSKDELAKVVTTIEKLEAHEQKTEDLAASIEQCHKARTDKFAAAYDEMKDFESDACRCKDEECAKKVRRDYDEWGEKLIKKFTKDELESISKEVEEKFDKVDDAIKDCLKKHEPVEQLKVTELSPSAGDANGGTYVLVKGSGFTSPHARMAKIYFGDRQGQVVRFQSDSELIVQAPGGRNDETVDVMIVFEPGGTLKIPKAFKFVDRDAGGPTVDDLAKPAP